jgi:hypothetical protein
MNTREIKRCLKSFERFQFWMAYPRGCGRTWMMIRGIVADSQPENVYVVLRSHSQFEWFTNMVMKTGDVSEVFTTNGVPRKIVLTNGRRIHLVSEDSNLEGICAPVIADHFFLEYMAAKASECAAELLAEKAKGGTDGPHR